MQTISSVAHIYICIIFVTEKKQKRKDYPPRFTLAEKRRNHMWLANFSRHISSQEIQVESSKNNTTTNNI